MNGIKMDLAKLCLRSRRCKEIIWDPSNIELKSFSLNRYNHVSLLCLVVSPVLSDFLEAVLVRVFLQEVVGAMAFSPQSPFYRRGVQFVKQVVQNLHPINFIIVNLFYNLFFFYQ